MPEVAGLSDVTDATGLTKQAIQQRLKLSRQAPEPLVRLAAGPVYLRQVLLEFLQNTPPKSRPFWDPGWVLVGRAEIAEMMGDVPGSAVSAKLRQKRAPDPVADLAIGRVYLKSEIESFLSTPASPQVTYEIDLRDVEDRYFTQGQTIAEISRRLKVPRHVLRQRLTDAGRTLRDEGGAEERARRAAATRRSVSPEEKAQILAALEAPRATINSVAVAFKRHPQTVQRIQVQADRQNKS